MARRNCPLQPIGVTEPPQRRIELRDSCRNTPPFFADSVANQSPTKKGAVLMNIKVAHTRRVRGRGGGGLVGFFLPQPAETSVYLTRSFRRSCEAVPAVFSPLSTGEEHRLSPPLSPSPPPLPPPGTHRVIRVKEVGQPNNAWQGCGDGGAPARRRRSLDGSAKVLSVRLEESHGHPAPQHPGGGRRR